MSVSTPVAADTAHATRIDLVALAILALGLAFRLHRIDVPFIDGHNWRQVTNADIARLWTEGPIDFFYPSVSWGGPDGRVGLEFPLLHLAMALVWRAFGISDVAGRLVPVAFSLATVWLTYLLGVRLFDRPTGRAAAFLMAVSPSVVYFGRTPLSDTPMLMFSVAAVWGYVAYTQSGATRYALLGAGALALAGLAKVPAILVLGPVLWTGVATRGMARTLRDPWFTAAPIAAMGAVFLWYLHADQVYLETGLTQAIFRPSGTYPGDIAQWAGPFLSVSHWTNAGILTMETAREMAWRFWRLHLTPLGAAGVLAGCVTARDWRRRSIVDVWALAALALIAVSLQGQFWHEFHQLPILPPLALYFGVGASPLFSAALYARLPAPWRLVAATAIAIALAAGSAFFFFENSRVITTLYRPDALNVALVDAGAAIDDVTPKDALLVTVEYDRYGNNSPLVLYFAHRKGWSFDATSITSGVIAYLHEKRGACYVAVSDWATLQARRPDVADPLRQATAVELPYANGRYRLFGLCGSGR